MQIEMDGKIKFGGEWDILMIGNVSVVQTAENIDRCTANLRYYISNTPITKENAVANFLQSFYSGVSDVNGTYVWGSSWTGIYAQNDDFEIGGHDIVKELTTHIGKYCYLIIEVL